MAAETNVIAKAQMAKVREVDFVNQFTHTNLDKLIEVLGVTRQIPMMEGTTMYVYTTTGTLHSGAVAEGDTIPLSQYKTEKKAVGEITLKKWRKGVTAEAIQKSGRDAAIAATDEALLRDVRKGIRTNLFEFLNGEITGSTTATGAGIQAAFADAWGKLQVKFEDDTASAVYFVNPEDVATYLGTANITVQTVFGMNYIENFLGLGTVIMNSNITKGTFIATAKENIIMYYLTMNGDIASEFDLTTDSTGYIGIKTDIPNTDRAQVETLAMGGIQFLVEYAGGVVKGTITSEAA